MTAAPRSAGWRRRLASIGALIALGGCSPVGLLNGLDRLTPGANDARRAGTDLAYGSLDRQKLDVWVPSRRAAGERLPVVVFFYGGGWSSGSRSEYGFAGAAYAGQQFVAVVPDYRLVPQARFPAFVEDGAAAVRWAQANAARYGGDPRRITVAGHSAGGYIAAMLALDPRWLPPGTVKAAALLAAPLDFAPFTDPRSLGAFGQWPSPADTQPISFVSPRDPPIFLGHGGNDRTVFPRNSQQLAARLGAAGVRHEFKLYGRANHTDLALSLSRPFRGRTPVLSDSAAFLRSATELPTSPAK
ncbi:MAG: carboxylesterase family protein [uncultured Sphingomonas sp.]|uniref:Carboxylesterase family protein n=1 Tax=uncultured Sphingomonas sp. TaxID=158754 RepID=A0A6J4TSF0_9SPHN|nr:MAG: carboxylesterase family protein [uncultured Sphingomonas sp.]